MIAYTDFQKNKALSELSTFRIGGVADYFIEVKEANTLSDVLQFCVKENIHYIVLGKGSNCIFEDEGFRGLVILNKIDFIEQIGNLFRVGAGYNFSLLGTQSARSGFSGLEFASGIPATVGGAVFMNAGANGKETCDHLVSVEYMQEEGSLICFQKDELHFSYRHSSFQGMRGAIVAATFALEPVEGARKRQIEIIDYRKKTQPLNEPSCGCIFKNPEGASAGALIEKSLLKGVFCGGVKVSEKHANFIVNMGNGSAKDVLDLIQVIKNRVKEQTGFELQEEIRVIKSRV